MKNIICPVSLHEELPNTPPLKIISSKNDIQESYSAYLTDESRLSNGNVDEVVFAHSENQIVEVLKNAYKYKIPVTISAGRTGIVGGAVPSGGILLSLENMNRFISARWHNERVCWIVRVQPGVSIENLQKVINNKDFIDSYVLLSSEDKESLKKFSNESDQWFYPPDPTEKSAHIGGTVATNASGARSLKYGQTRNFVMSLRVVLADGTLLNIKRGVHVATSKKEFYIQKKINSIEIPIPSYESPEVKNTAGYYIHHPMDFIDFFIGSEGTLGIITEIELTLRKKPEFILCGVAFFPSEENAVNFVKLIRGQKEKIYPTALEYFDYNSLQLLGSMNTQEKQKSSIPSFPLYAKSAVYFEQESRERDFEEIYIAYDEILSECGTSMDDTWGGMDEKELSRMSDFRHALPEVVNTIIGQRQKRFPGIHKVGTDFVVPHDALEKMMKIYKSKLNKENFEYLIFGHIGENHLHLNIIPRDERELEKAKNLYLEFAKEAVALKGTVSGEHGIGKIKKPLLQIMYNQKEIEDMKKVKRILDPNNILGKGNIF